MKTKYTVNPRVDMIIGEATGSSNSLEEFRSSPVEFIGQGKNVRVKDFIV